MIAKTVKQQDEDPAYTKLAKQYPGIANIVVFKRHASSVLRIHEVKTDNQPNLK